MKDKFLTEINKKNSGQAYDEKVVGEYYLPVFPESTDFKELISDLTNLLETVLLPGRGYKFSFHLVCPTRDYNFALIFLETNSVLKVGELYEDKVPFEI